jgi:hypothetical protein
VRFTPKTERELAEEGLIPAGTVCDFEVIEAEEKQSRAGNDMVALQLKVWRPNGSTTTLRDWLVSNFPGKLMSFANSTSMRDAYDAGEMTADAMVGRCGKLKVGIEEANGDYPARNKVASYVKSDAQPDPARGGGAKPGGKPALDDDIPFAAETRA